MKGESSGHTQTVKDVAFDCDGDTLLIQVEQIGAACHEGYQSCFFRSVQGDGAAFKITEAQLQTPGQIYGRRSDGFVPNAGMTAGPPAAQAAPKTRWTTLFHLPAAATR